MTHIGILGGGQLARMLALAAYPLGIRISVLVKQPGLNTMGWNVHSGDWDNPSDASQFAQSVDIVTLENEFVSQEALEAIERAGVPLYPTASSVKLVQDKFIQRETLARSGLPVPAHSSTPTLSYPQLLKRRRFSYDGKGNLLVRAPSNLPPDVEAYYAESLVDFERELAVMITRGRDGSSVAYPVVETVQKDHICHTVRAPADIPEPLHARAVEIALKAVSVFGGIGTWGVEMFLTRDRKILINEMAPRVHNSGHYTIEACECSQFENHLRAILGRPLGSAALRAPAAAMVNLLGSGDGPGEPSGLDAALAVPGAHIHLYGKDRSVRGRKMGHVTALGATPQEALAIAQRAADSLRFG